MVSDGVDIVVRVLETSSYQKNTKRIGMIRRSIRANQGCSNEGLNR